jgi:hypothetical protein
LVPAAAKLMSCWTIPTISPPITLIAMMIRPAIASPRTNFDAPSIDP